MKKSRLALLLLFAIVLTACATPTPTPEPILTLPPTETSTLPTAVPATPVSSLTVESLKNGTYTVPQYQKVVTLTDGKYESGSGDNYLMVTLLPQIALGDLNGDGTTDAAILLSENGGGSGQFVSLIVILDQNSSPVQLAGSVLIDDRPVIQSLVIQDASIILKALIHGPNDPMVSPTHSVTETYRLDQGYLWLSRLTTAAQDGSEISIDIENPEFDSVVASPVQVTGSMPYAPFENTLGYIITDAAGNELTTGSFMVTAADVNAPATFDHTFDLSVVPSGSVVHIILFEGDMSGFSKFRIMDAVEVIVQ